MWRAQSHPEADAELEEAAVYYEQCAPDLGHRFLDDYLSTLRRILSDPFRWRRIHGENRKLNFRRFPYGIVFSNDDDRKVVFVKAVMHLHRLPLYWQHRVIP